MLESNKNIKTLKNSRMDREALAHSVAGTGGTLAAMIITMPLDTLRARLQAAVSAARSAARRDEEEGSREESEDVVEVAARSGDWGKVVVAIMKKEGLGGFYRGLGPKLTALAFAQAMYLYIFTAIKGKLAEKRKNGQLHAVELLGAAYVAGAVNATLTAPLWTAVTRLQVGSGSSTSLGGAMLEIAKEKGVGALWNGWEASLVLCANPAINYAVYESLKTAVLRSQGRDPSSSDLSPTEGFVLGAVSKSIATVATYPLQVIQTRAQVGSGENRSISQAIYDIVEQEGVEGLWKGLTPKLLQTTLSSAFLFGTYEGLLSSSRLFVAVAVGDIAISDIIALLS